VFLHLITDEKFIDGAIIRFTRNDPGRHTFLFLYKGGFEGFHYIKQESAVQAVFVGSEIYGQYLSRLSSYDAVFLHGLFSPHVIDLVNRATPEVVFVWLFWGGELWSFKNIRDSMMLPATRRIYRWNALKAVIYPNLRKYTDLIRHLKFGVIRDALFAKVAARSSNVPTEGVDSLEKAIRRVNYVIPVIPNDYEVLKKRFALKAKILDWNYSLGISLDSRADKTVSGHNIAVGNSAHYTNNHLDIFRYIRKIKNWDGRVIVPLSYGDAEYRNDVIRAGERLFGGRFMPLVTYMPVEEYLTLMESCSCAYFNTLRQQAMGNIVMLLCQGTKVFLREENPAYDFLRRNEIVVFPIDSNILRNTGDIRVLPESDIIKNRFILNSLYSEKSLDSKTRNLVEFLGKQGGTIK
jgi:hypothetical protein